TPGSANVSAEASTPRFSQVSVGGGQLTLSWSAVAGHDYQIEFKDELTQPAWRTLSQVHAVSATPSVTDNVAAARQRYYRVRMLPCGRSHPPLPFGPPLPSDGRGKG